MIRLICIENPAIIISAPDELVSEVGGNCYQIGGPQPLTYPKHLWKKESQPSLPSNLDKAAEKYAKENCENYVDEEDGVTYIEEALRNTFKAGAEWMAGQFVLVGGDPTGWFRANNGSEYATGLDLKEPIKLPVDFYVRKEK